MSYTSGPWGSFISGREHTITDNPAATEKGVGYGTNFIATVHYVGTAEATEANAKLIAAAPRLLEACQLALIQFGANEDYSDDDKEAVDALREAIRAALEGEEE